MVGFVLVFLVTIAGVPADAQPDPETAWFASERQCQAALARLKAVSASGDPRVRGTSVEALCLPIGVAA